MDFTVHQNMLSISNSSRKKHFPLSQAIAEVKEIAVSSFCLIRRQVCTVYH